jgi:hypothetical protein
MFGFFKSKDKTNADKVILLLQRAIAEVHPDRFIDPLDGALVRQPRRSQLNEILGVEESRLFERVHYNALVAKIAVYEERGLIGQLGSLMAHDVVLMSLILAAMHENHGTSKKQEINQQARLLLNYINTDS